MEPETSAHATIIFKKSNHFQPCYCITMFDLLADMLFTILMFLVVICLNFLLNIQEEDVAEVMCHEENQPQQLQSDLRQQEAK